MPGSDLIAAPGGDLGPAAAGCEVRRLAAVAADYAELSKGSSTRRAYAAHWIRFAAWCEVRDLEALPASASTLILYLADVAPGRSVSTINQILAAIRFVHRRADKPIPASGRLDEVWAGIRHAHGRPPRKKRALVLADLKRVLARLEKRPRLVRARDRAILLVCFAGALRRSELAPLELDAPGADLAVRRCSFVAGGLLISLGRSKTDAEGRGQVVGIPWGKTRLCPVAALRAWLDLSEISRGPIFRPIDRHGRLGASAMSGAAVNEIVKRALAGTGLNPDEFGAHSLRSGFLTTGAAADVSLELLMRQARHTKAETTMGYIRDANIFTRNAAGKVGL